MQYPGCRARGLILSIALSASSCAPAIEDPDVTYGAELPAAPFGAEGVGGAVTPGGSGGSGGNVGNVGNGGNSRNKVAAAGSGGVRVYAAGSGGSAASAAAGGAVGAAGAGAGASAGSAASDGSGGSDAAAGTTATTGIQAVSFDVTTLPQGGKYSPRNIGAIWVQSSSGTFVKSLELWARQRRTHLTKFNGAVGTAGPVDVTASATLSSHRAHHVSWNLKDRSGASVAPGKYTLLIEVTDYDGPGKWYALEFDTSAGAQVVMPASVTYYNGMSLRIE